MAVEDNSSDCMPQYFDKIVVDANEIVIIDNMKSGITQKFVIKPNRETELQLFDKNGKPLEKYKTADINAYIGEEVGERIELIEWNGNVARFRLKRECLEPACIPGKTEECILEVKDLWERE